LDDVLHPVRNDVFYLALHLPVLLLVTLPSKINAKVLLQLMIGVLFYLLQFDRVELLHRGQLIQL
jgi:hypothetical protein